MILLKRLLVTQNSASSGTGVERRAIEWHASIGSSFLDNGVK